MTTSNDPDQIRAEIARTRAELSDNVDSLTDTANPKNIANRRSTRSRTPSRGVKDKIMGSPDDAYDDGASETPRRLAAVGRRPSATRLRRARAWPRRRPAATRWPPA